MGIKFVLLIVVLGLFTIEQSFGRRNHDDDDDDDRRAVFGFGRPSGPKGPRRGLSFNVIRNVTCEATSVQSPAEPPCSICICFPENVLNCLSLRPRFCNSNSTTTTEATAGPA